MPSRLHSGVERHVPHLDGRVRSSPRQPAAAAPSLGGGQPEHGVDAPGYGILDRDVLYRLSNAPDVDVRVERARGAVLRVRGPAERVHPCAVEGPARGDQLALGHVVQDDLPARLWTGNKGKNNTSAQHAHVHALHKVKYKVNAGTKKRLKTIYII